jgi:Fe-S cluster assembly iron-binding protein IscA
MLELSPRAAAALENLRETEGIPADHGIRLTGQPQPTGDLAVHLEFVESVPENDQLVEQSGTQVHIDPQIAEPLSDVVMDVQPSEQGAAFVFRPQDS